MQIGIRGHDLCPKGTVNDLTQAMKDADLDTLQLVSYKSFADITYDPASMTAEKAAAIGEALTKNNQKIALLGAYFNPVHSDKEKVAKGIQVFKSYLAVAKTLGCPVVGSETGSYNDDQWTYHKKNRTEEARRIVTDTFLSLCDTAEEYGAFVGIEGAAGHVLYDVKTLHKTVQDINRKNLLVIFDLYNFLDENNSNDYLAILEEGLQAFSKQIVLFHIKDCKLSNGKPEQCPVGRGDFDFTKILSKIRAYDENPVLILEGTTGEDIAYGVKTIKETWKKLQ